MATQPVISLKSQVYLSQLVVVDVQTKLTAVMPIEAVQQVLRNVGNLIAAAQLLAVPLVITEQYSKGLGNTEPALLAAVPHIQALEKITFSGMATPKFAQQLSGEKSQIVLAGMEAHICVLQTALDLIAASKQVFVVEDAIISRAPANKTNAVARLREAGCVITNTESVLFEWLGAAQGDAFKAISQMIK